MSIIVEFELSREDWNQAVSIYYRKRPRQANPLRPLAYAGFAATALGFLLLVQRPDGGGWIAPVALMGIGLFIPLRFSAVRWGQNDAAWAEAERLIQPTLWEFDPNFVRTSSPDRQCTWQWSRFDRWIESPTIFLLYETEHAFHTIPKRAFTGEEQVAQLRQLLIDRIPDKQRGFAVVPVKPRE